MIQDFIPKQELSLESEEEKLTFAQSVANRIFGEEGAMVSPAKWEEVGGNKRYNLHPYTNNWWLHQPDRHHKNWRLSARYASVHKIRCVLAPLAEELI